MECRYEYTEGILKGKRCNNRMGYSDLGHPGFGYCFKHAQKLGLIPKAELEEYEDRKNVGIRKAQRKRGTEDWGRTYREKKAKIEAKQEEIKSRVKSEREEKEMERVRDLMHTILGDKDYDAEELAKELKGANADFKYTEKNVKFIFIGWYVSDIETRKPKTLRELCKLLGISMVQGLDWINSDWFVHELNKTMVRVMKLAMPYLQRMNLMKSLLGDFNAYKEYVKYFGRDKKFEGGDDFTSDMAPDIEQEVEEMEKAN